MNESKYINTTISSQEPQVPSVYYYVAFTLGLLVVLISSLTILVLSRCTKLVFQVKFTSINLTVSNLLFGLIVVVDPVYYFVHGSGCKAIIGCFVFCFTTYYLFLTVSGIDRLLSLRLALKYLFWTKRKNAYIATISIYITAFLLSISNIIGTDGDFRCEGNPREILTFQGLMIFSLTLLILLLIQIAAYGYIGVNVLGRYKKSKERSGNPSHSRKAFKSFMRITVKSFYICVLSTVLIGPFIVTKLVEALTRSDTDDVIYKVSFISFVLIVAHQIGSPIFILLSYKECRYHFLIIIHHFNKEKRAKLESEYKQHYATYGIAAKPETHF